MKSIVRAIVIPLVLVLLMFLLALLEESGFLLLRSYGTVPRTKIGLIGILSSPFLHSGYKHLFSNMFPFFFLASLLFYSYKKMAAEALVFMYIFPGLLVWLSARDGNHIGASGMVYALSSFLIVIGLLRKNMRSLALAFLVIFLYGGLIWGIFPEFFPEKSISWEGHLWGMITGIVLAFFYRKRDLPQNYVEEEEEEEADDDDENAYWKTDSTLEEAHTRVRYYYPKGMKR